MTSPTKPLPERLESVHRTHRGLIRVLEKQIADVDYLAIYHASNETTARLFTYRAKLVEMLRQLDRVRLPQPTEEK